jgi:hypothetical protein
MIDETVHTHVVSSPFKLQYLDFLTQKQAEVLVLWAPHLNVMNVTLS